MKTCSFVNRTWICKYIVTACEWIHSKACNDFNENNNGFNDNDESGAGLSPVCTQTRKLAHIDF